MANFRYQALDPTGQLASGELEAQSVQQAVAQLEARGLSVQSIGVATPATTSAGSSPTATADASGTAAASPDGESVEQAVLRSHLATVLERGQALVPALEAYSQEMPRGRRRRELSAVCQVLADGESSQTATLAELPEHWIPLLSAAAASADAGHVLREFLWESRRTDDLRHHWWLALAYPIVLVIMATTVMWALSLFVIPQFASIFQEFGLALPWLTQFVLGLAQWLSRWGIWLLALLLVVLLLLMFKAKRILPVAAFAWLGDRVPTPYARRTSIARFARFLGDLLAAGVSLSDSLRIAGYSIHRSRMRHAAWNLAHRIESSGERWRGFDSRQLTAAVTYAVTAALPTATRVRLLREISQCHAQHVRTGLSWTGGLVEPAAICLVAMVVGVIVLGLFLPLVKLIEGLSG